MADGSFGSRVASILDTRGPLCIGIDPHTQSLRDWGLNDDIAGAEYFSRTMIEAVAGQVAFIKPQSAFFERFGAAGIGLLERVIQDSRRAGAQVILDVKRGDVGSTMHAYAQAYLDPASPLAADAITVSPFLGVGALGPVFNAAAEYDRGVFVLALTSNPEGADVQMARRADGRTVAQSIIDELAEANAGREPLGALGVVVGATVADCRQVAHRDRSTYPSAHAAVQTGETAHDLTGLNGPILVPGMGAQGGQPADLPRVLGDAATWAVPTYSREIARQGPDGDALRESVRQAMEACRTAIGR